MRSLLERTARALLLASVAGVANAANAQTQMLQPLPSGVLRITMPRAGDYDSLTLPPRDCSTYRNNDDVLACRLIINGMLDTPVIYMPKVDSHLGGLWNDLFLPRCLADREWWSRLSEQARAAGVQQLELQKVAGNGAIPSGRILVLSMTSREALQVDCAAGTVSRPEPFNTTRYCEIQVGLKPNHPVVRRFCHTPTARSE